MIIGGTRKTLTSQKYQCAILRLPLEKYSLQTCSHMRSSQQNFKGLYAVTVVKGDDHLKWVLIQCLLSSTSCGTSHTSCPFVSYSPEELCGPDVNSVMIVPYVWARKLFDDRACHLPKWVHQVPVILLHGAFIMRSVVVIPILRRSDFCSFFQVPSSGSSSKAFSQYTVSMLSVVRFLTFWYIILFCTI